MAREKDIQAVLFDLDGTLADTAPDMVGALNLLCLERGKEPIPFPVARPHVSHGSRALVNLGFPDASETDAAMLVARFLELYRRNLCTATQVFDEMNEVLATLERQRIEWGIVTNKPAYLTDPLIELLKLSGRTRCVISGDTLPERKPHAMPLLHASELLSVRPERCLYVGDAERDIVAGRAAGMYTLVACYGYIVEDENPAGWQADGLIDRPRDILAWLTAGPETEQGNASTTG